LPLAGWRAYINQYGNIPWYMWGWVHTLNFFYPCWFAEKTCTNLGINQQKLEVVHVSA
jgi:hypothetical protein